MAGTTRSIWVVGEKKFQNHLVASYLEERLGFPCTVRSGLPPETGREADTFPAEIILHDCPPPDRQDRLDALLAQVEQLHPAQSLGLFNLNRTHGIERRAFFSGVKGFFYEDDPPQTLEKGVRTLMTGEFWMSRRVMTDCLALQRQLTAGIEAPAASTTRKLASLTRREREVLSLVALGTANDDIAGRLCISVHTVKTHVYRIFQKVGVTNRLQAALFAASAHQAVPSPWKEDSRDHASFPPTFY